MDMKISIIIPVYNGQAYIRRCVESLINQTYKNIEIIIVNDGSIDNTKDICEEIKKRDDRILLLSIKNGGVANARNLGIQQSSGNYIMFVDADDYIEDNMCESLMNILIKEDADIVVSKAIDEDNNGNVIQEVNLSSSKWINYDENYNFCSKYSHFVCWGALYKKDVIPN